MDTVRWAATAVMIAAMFLVVLLIPSAHEFISDVRGGGDELPSPPSARPVPTAMPMPAPTPTLTPAAATSTPSPEASPIAEVTPVAEFEVTVISAVVPANVREAPTTEADLAGVIPIGVKAKVVGKVIGQEAFPGTGNRIWYLVKAIPPDLPEDGFVHSGVVKW